MPHLNGTGPEKLGMQTGRKLGSCTENDKKDVAQMGIGRGKRLKSGGGSGKGKRLKYNSNK